MDNFGVGVKVRNSRLVNFVYESRDFTTSRDASSTLSSSAALTSPKHTHTQNQIKYLPYCLGFFNNSVKISSFPYKNSKVI